LIVVPLRRKARSDEPASKREATAVTPAATARAVLGDWAPFVSAR
jgi:hypothetical protein